MSPDYKVRRTMDPLPQTWWMKELMVTCGLLAISRVLAPQAVLLLLFL
jgi:hypothetical protein